MSEMKLLELFKLVKKEMISFGLSENSLRNYEYNGFQPILQFFTKEKEDIFSVHLVKQCVFHMQKQYEISIITYERFRATRKVGSILEEFSNNNMIEWKHLPRWNCKQHLGQYFTDVLSSYIGEMENIYSRNTINDYKSIISQLLNFLELKGHKNFNNISLKEISEFIPHIAVQCPSSMKGVMTALRSFSSFLNNKKLINIDMHSVLHGVPAKRRKIFPGFSHDEADAILKAVNRKNAVGKRDYAMLLLAKNTGLRSIDIINLKRNNINWWKNEIHIIQHKTGRPLILPLDCEVGNAIADYILHSRPHSETPYIFLCIFPPHKKLSDHGPLYAILSKYMKIAGINHNVGERKGTHSFRRSLGTWMLEEGVSLSTIGEVLGHSNPNSSKSYISTSKEKLRECTLSLDGIEVTREELI